MSEGLPATLDKYYHDTLLQIAAFNGLPSMDSDGHRMRKDALIAMLCERLYVPERARTMLSRLNATQRTVLDRILLYGGEVDTYILRDEVERDGVLPAEGPEAETPAARPGAPERTLGEERSAPEHLSGMAGDEHSLATGQSTAGPLEVVLAELTLRGLVLSSGNPESWNALAKLDLNPGLRLIVPLPLRKHLPQPALPSVEWGSTTLPAPPAETSTCLAQRDLFLYWSHVRNEPLTLTQAGLVQKRSLRAINEQLLSGDPALGTAANELQSPRLHFLRLLLLGTRLLVREGSKLRSAGPHAPVPEFWERSVEERTSACLRVWLRMTDWSELSSLGMSSFDLDLPRARSLLLEQLLPLEPGVWFSADRFLTRLSMTVTHLLFGGRVARGSAMYYNTEYLTQQSRRLAQVEATFAGGALSGPLHWLGLVDVSADDGGLVPRSSANTLSRSGAETLPVVGESRLLAFRVNSSAKPVLRMAAWRPAPASPGNAVYGEAARSGQAGAPEAAEARVIVQPNFQVFALGAVPEATLARLEIFADRVKADRSAFEYTLSRAAFYRGQQSGLTADQVITYLELTSDAALPQNVRRTLQEWGEQHERIVFRRAVSLCEAASPAALDEVCNEPATQVYVQQRLTPTVALLKKGRQAALRERLLQRGILPAVSSRADRCAGRVQAAPDGELRPVHEGPDLLLNSCLRALADEREGDFRITQTSVSRALTTGLSVTEYLDRLQTVHHGDLPPELRARIKAWGRYYGKAVLQQAVLLEVKDAATAAELLADAELAPLLSRFEADPRGRLLLVQTQDVERLRRLLGERGVEVVQQM